MDLVLEVFDSLILDKVWAQLLPASIGQGAPAAKSTTDFLAGAKQSLNGTQSDSGLTEIIQSIMVPVMKLDKLGKSDRYGLCPPEWFDVNQYTYASLLGRENWLRQAISLAVITTIFGWVLYFSIASLSYFFIYDPENFKHPKYLKNQVRLEISQATRAIPVMTLLTVPWFVLETQGFSKLYGSIQDHGGWTYFVLQFPLFLVFTDACIYMIHRWLHHPLIYKHLHKPHHKWIVPTPFASHAFHPMDGYFQSLPYHIFPFIFPLQKMAYVALFAIVNVWTVMIHDGEYLANDPIVNGSACHTVHHLYFNYNYGQYTTLWDRLGGTHRTPDQELYDKSLRTSQSTLKKQISQMESIQREVEGDDYREYISAKVTTTTVSN